MNSEDNPCKKFACLIQKCLSENNYQEEKCTRFINQWSNCCSKLAEPSVSCPGLYTPNSKNQ